MKGSIINWNGKVVRVNAYGVPVKDSIRAGDAYAGVFLASILKGFNVENAVSAVATMVVMVRGDEKNLSREEDLEKFLSGYDEQVDFR